MYLTVMSVAHTV